MNTQLVAWLKRAGFKGPALRTMYGIAMRESGGDPHAYNGKGNDRSYGLTQINMLGPMGEARKRQFKLSSYDDLFDPVTNAKIAYRMSGGGKNFGPWGIGPQAYRQGAGEDTIAKYLHEFDNAGIDIESIQPLAPGRRPSLAQSRGRLSPTDLKSFDHRQMALRSLASLATGDYDPMQGLSDLVSARREYEARREAAAAQEPSGGRVGPPGGPPVKPTTVKGGKGFVFPEAFTGTHVTDKLGWGTETAHDFILDAGTPVIAPVGGRVEYFHKEGAQGGGSMLFIGDDGREFWLGHIDDGLADGTKVKAGQQLAIVSPHHATPHLHLDVRST